MIIEQRVLEEVNTRAVEGRPLLRLHDLARYVQRSRVELTLLLRHWADMRRVRLDRRTLQTKDGFLTIVTIGPGDEFSPRLEELRRRDAASDST